MARLCADRTLKTTATFVDSRLVHAARPTLYILIKSILGLDQTRKASISIEDLLVNSMPYGTEFRGYIHVPAPAGGSAVHSRSCGNVIGHFHVLGPVGG
ncbi:MAG: hypothetical protein OXF31_12820 [Gammaproteobacteria bacterium]|nr:hypothetical protein [Gammaproteobacteria bacterium]